MRTINANQCVKIPRGIEAHVKSRIVTIKGPRGVLKRNFKHLSLDISMVSPRTLKVEKWFGAKKELAAVRTVCSHILNMIKGMSTVVTWIMVSGLNLSRLIGSKMKTQFEYQFTAVV